MGPEHLRTFPAWGFHAGVYESTNFNLGHFFFLRTLLANDNKTKEFGEVIIHYPEHVASIGISSFALRDIKSVV